MENSLKRKNIHSSGSGFTPKVNAIKNAGRIPSHISNRHILTDVQNVKMLSSGEKAVRGAISQKAAGGASFTMRSVHLDNSLPALPLPDTSASTNTTTKPSGKESRSIPPASSSQSSTKEVLETILTKLNNLEEQNQIILQEVRANNAMLKNVFKRQSKSGFKKPEFLPFTCVEELVAFNSANEEKFVEVVNFLAYLGGLNINDAAARYLKQCLVTNKELISKITWTGSRKTNTVSLGATKFIEACEQAMALNTSWIVKPTKTEFIFSMNKALKSLKERLRRKLQEPEARARRAQQADEWTIMQDEINDEDRAQTMEEVEEEVEEEAIDSDDDTRESQDLFSLYN